MEIDVSKLDVLQKLKEESKLDEPINIYKNLVLEPKEEPQEIVTIPIIQQQEEPEESPLVVILRTYIDEVCKAPDSIIDTIDTGNPVVVRKKKKKPQFATPLFKETFLSEFRSETEKKKARENLGVYSTKEIDLSVSDLNDRITLVLNDNLAKYLNEELAEVIADLDFVKATLVKTITYNIPSNI